MSKSDTQKTTPDTEQSEERVDDRRREALVRFGKYTAPALLGVLASKGIAAPITPI